MTPVYGSRAPRYQILLALFGEAEGWNCEECPFCEAKDFPACKNWIAHLGVAHNDEHLLYVADEIWGEVMLHKFESQEELEEFVREEGRQCGAVLTKEEKEAIG